jgi:hypothetical protein
MILATLTSCPKVNIVRYRSRFMQLTFSVELTIWPVSTVVNKQSCLGIAWGLLGVAKQLNLIRLLAVLVATQSIKGGLLGVA